MAHFSIKTIVINMKSFVLVNEQSEYRITIKRFMIFKFKSRIVINLIRIIEYGFGIHVKTKECRGIRILRP